MCFNVCTFLEILTELQKNPCATEKETNQAVDRILCRIVSLLLKVLNSNNAKVSSNL